MFLFNTFLWSCVRYLKTLKLFLINIFSETCSCKTAVAEMFTRANCCIVVPMSNHGSLLAVRVIPPGHKQVELTFFNENLWTSVCSLCGLTDLIALHTCRHAHHKLLHVVDEKLCSSLACPPPPLPTPQCKNWGCFSQEKWALTKSSFLD